MRYAIKIGLVVGLIGLVLTFCISGFVGLFSMASPFLAGGLAGYFAGSKALSKGKGAEYGLFAGAIAGGIVSHGEMIGRALVAIAQYSQMKSAYGSAIGPFSVPSDFLTTYILTLWPALSFGGLAGAGAGFLGTSEPPASTPPGDAAS